MIVIHPEYWLLEALLIFFFSEMRCEKEMKEKISSDFIGLNIYIEQVQAKREKTAPIVCVAF